MGTGFNEAAPAPGKTTEEAGLLTAGLQPEG